MAFLLFILFSSETCNNNKQQESTIIKSEDLTSIYCNTVKIGNQWVYVDTFYKNNELYKIRYDTLTITSKEKFKEEDCWVFNERERVLFRRDSIYSIQTWRGGKEFAALEYFRSDKKVRYTISIDADAKSERTVIKMDKPYKIGNIEYDKCYLYDNRCSSYDIISYGVGLIKSKKDYCTPTQLIKIRTLVNYNFN